MPALGLLLGLQLRRGGDVDVPLLLASPAQRPPWRRWRCAPPARCGVALSGREQRKKREGEEERRRRRLEGERGKGARVRGEAEAAVCFIGGERR